MQMIEKKKVVVFVAHPDDETACGGTIAKQARANNTIVQVIATNGDKGTHDKNVSPTEIFNIRKQEMANTAEVLGISKVIWLGFEDGTLEKNTHAVKEKAFRVIREEKPDVVITFDPWKRWDVHSDHRTIGFTSSEAAYLADGYWYYPEHSKEGLEPHDVKETYLFHTDEPNYTVDVKDTFSIKKKAADEHKSQSLQFETFGDKYISRLKAMVKNEDDLYKEFFRKLNQSDLEL
jgi:LmbE family N-acetylglucosaminyl deacetylase